MAQGAAIVARWAALLAQQQESTGTIDFAQEAEAWQSIANEFTIKTHLMWHEGWFRDYDAVAQEWSSQADTMHLSPVFAVRRAGACRTIAGVFFPPSYA